MRYPTKKQRYKKYILITLIILILLAFFVTAYFYIKKLKDPVLPAINAVPENAVALIEIKNTPSLVKKIHTKNNIWKTLQELDFIEKFHKNVLFLDSITSENKEISEILKLNPLFISWIPDRNKYSILALINLSDAHSEKMISNFIKKHFSVDNNYTHSFINSRIHKFYGKNNNELFYTVYKGIFMISASPSAIEQALSSIITNISIDNNTYFKRLKNASGKNVDMNLYLKNAYIDKLFEPFSNSKHHIVFRTIAFTGEMTALDLTLKNEELLLAGYTLTSDTSQFLQKVFSNETSQEITLTEICPSNTLYMLFFGFDLAERFVDNLNTFMGINYKKRKFNEIYDFYLQNYNIDISELFVKHIDNETAFVVTENPNIDNPYAYYAVVKSNNIRAFNESLKKISIPAEKLSIISEDTTIIRKLTPHLLLSSCFGNIFQNLDTAYYTILKDYVVFSNSVLSLQMFVSAYISGKTLNKNPNYISFSDNVADKVNFCFYANVRNGFTLFAENFNNNIKGKLLEKKEKLQNLQAIALQFSAENNRFFINAYVKYNKDYVSESPTLWEFTADTVLYGKVSIIHDFSDNTKKIIIFDASGKMYLLNAYGQLLWKKKIPEMPLGKVFAFGVNNNKICYLLFNSKNNIYIFDTKGQQFSLSPVKLPFSASTSITLVDYNNKGDYRIIIPCENQYIYNYRIDGKPTPGWTNYRPEAKIIKPIEYYKLKGKDILVATDKNGKVYFIDKKGKLLIKNTVPFIKAKNSNFYLYDLDNKIYLTTSDRKGKLIFISDNGKTEVVTLNDIFSENHYFIAADYNSDLKKDFIFFDKEKIMVYNHQKRKIFDYTLNIPLAGSPSMIQISNKKIYFIYQTNNSSKLILFNDKVTHTLSAYTKQPKEIESGQLLSNKIFNVLVADSNILMNFPIN